MITRGFFTGTSPIALTASGIPAGVNFVDNGNGSWSLTGTWPAAGTYTYSVTATNPGGSLTVPGNQLISTPAPVAPIPPSVPNISGSVGAAISYTSPAFGGTAPIALTVAGLPGGATFADNGNGTFTLGGTFPAQSTSAVTVTGTNVAGTGSVSFNLVSTAIAPIAPSGAPFSDTGVSGTAI